MNIRGTLLLLLALSLLPVSLVAQDDDEVDFLDLAALMIRDGNLDRAIIALEQVDQEEEALDWVRFHTLMGVANMRQGKLEPAREAFRRAIAAGQPDSVVYVYLAQVSYDLEDYQGTLDALDQAGDDVVRLPAVYHMRAQCHWHLEQHARAFATLEQASRIFEGDPQFLRRQVFYLVELGLYKEAAGLGRQYLAVSEGTAQDYVAIGDALRRSGDVDAALDFLESAGLQFPGDTLVAKATAHAYIDREQYNVAADIIYQTSLADPALMGEAVELYRRAGQLDRALALNAQLADQPAKFKQRMALLLQLEAFDEAAAMEPAMHRVGLLEDQDLRYALAYALFKSGSMDQAEQHLAQLTRADLFRKAVELRRAMEDCASDAWRCL